jgi:hypothetical protein
MYFNHQEKFLKTLYKSEYVCDKEILGVIWAFTEKFDKTTSLAFTKWLNKQNVDLLSDDPEPKVFKRNTGNEEMRRRCLNVLNSAYYGKARKWYRK